MQEVFEKIIERLERCRRMQEEAIGRKGKYALSDEAHEHGASMYENAIEIVSQAAAEYNNGWIPVEDELPDHNIDVEVTLASGIRHIAWYSRVRESWIDTLSDNEHVIDVIAWRSPTEPYQPKGE